jgi:hypothetical protein
MPSKYAELTSKMPCKTKTKKKKAVKRVHCSKCGRISPKTADNFAKRMAWLRRHRKRKHPTAHKKSVKKTIKTKKERGLIA